MYIENPSDYNELGINCENFSNFSQTKNALKLQKKRKKIWKTLYFSIFNLKVYFCG
jgi:hypothetical protein